MDTNEIAKNVAATLRNDLPIPAPVIDANIVDNKAASFVEKGISAETEGLKEDDKQAQLMKEAAERAVAAYIESANVTTGEREVVNAIRQYRINCEQRKLNLKTKLEKKAIREEVKAEVEGKRARIKHIII